MNQVAFDKLKPEKQKRILNSAFNEFSKNIYDKVSVFQIAKNANISRASFYCYFSDKKDIYLFLLNKLKEDVFSSIDLNCNSIDPFDTLLKIFNKFADYKGTDYQNFIEMFFKNLNPTTQNVFVADTKLFGKVKNKFNLSKYSDEISEKECITMFEMLFFGFSIKLNLYYTNKLTKEEVIKSFDKIIYFILNGILKDDENARIKKYS